MANNKPAPGHLNEATTGLAEEVSGFRMLPREPPEMTLQAGFAG
ncbi:MAG: hypothetical protein ACO3JG_04135 [Luteolibacter sp.]